MNPLLTDQGLRRQNNEFYKTGGVSTGNHTLGFVPAFLDSETGQIYRSCFRNGTPAPCHLLEGLPTTLTVKRDTTGRAMAVKASVVAGFMHSGRFYTREQAARAVAGETLN